ncbi:WD40-repeat-containing domain protein [Cercophora samala]|uniref:WD40-repeat-containing domain protein n=1 Tax=Cercophora samala TaxID=330535 RepID=A0AA39ZP31_9PEZI|nr:WD40-repeat-containing domain protein [Cercophora samala]
MASTPSNRLKLTPNNSPFLSRPSRSPIRPRGFCEPGLSLRRVIGTTCSSPTGFDTVHSSFAYIAGGAVVVVDVSGEHYSQRFYRARPSAVPVFSVSPVSNSSSTPNSTPKANDSRNRAAPSPREGSYGGSDWLDAPSSKTWTSRERIKAATCLALSRDGRYLAVGETGYAPRVLIFNLQDVSSDTPLVSISEHTFGVNAVAWSPDTKFLASLGAANDGFLYLWKIDPRTGAAKLFQQNRCTAQVKGMFWMGSNLITLGVRHVKVWRVDEASMITPVKPRFGGDQAAQAAAQQAQKPLSGRNILLGTMLDETFVCAIAISDEKAIICSETGHVCLLDDTNKQMKLVKVLDLGFNIGCISSRDGSVYVGGKEDGDFALVSLEGILSGMPDPTLRSSRAPEGLTAMGFLAENLVTVNSKQSIDVWSPDYMPGTAADDTKRIPIPGPGDPIVGTQRLSTSNKLGAAFFTWSGYGRVNIWDMEGMIKSAFDIPIEQLDMGNDVEVNQVVVVRATTDGSLFVAGDKLGVLRIVDSSTGECVMETKAHSSDCQDITIHEGKSRTLIASCGRDRTVQLFQRLATGAFEHFQTLEFTAKVVQVLIPAEDKLMTCSLDRTIQIHDLVTKENEPDAMAAIPSKVISLKASPSSMTVTPDEKAIYVALLDRSVCHFDFSTGRLLGSFKCNDEAGLESVVLESLTFGQLGNGELAFLLGISNTDKSVRVYDAQSGLFLDREWGHTEAINGVVLIDGDEGGKRVVSVGEDGTIMIWTLEFQDPIAGGSRTRDPSPDKNISTSTRPPLRKVLSKAELAEFQRPTTSSGGRRSPPRASHRRTSKFHVTTNTARTPNTEKQQLSPGSGVVEDTPSRRASSGGSRSDSPPPPPESPKNRARMFRRPSLPALNMTPTATIKSKKKSNQNMRSGYGFGSLSMATEQTCRQLRAYRKKLNSSDSINSDILSELDAELRLTAAALGERAIRSRSNRTPDEHKPVSESMLSGLLDQYSERLVSMLDEKLRLRLSEEEKDSLVRDRPRTSGEGSSTSEASTGGTFTDAVLCEEPGSA